MECHLVSHIWDFLLLHTGPSSSSSSSSSSSPLLLGLFLLLALPFASYAFTSIPTCPTTTTTSTTSSSRQCLSSERRRRRQTTTGQGHGALFMINPRPSSSSPSTTKLSKIPTSGQTFYDDVRKQAIDAVNAALKAGVQQIEIEFPVSPGRIDVSLGEFLDESRRWTREFIRPYTTKGKKLWVIFPDGKEATLAYTKWGEGNFQLMSIDSAKKIPKTEGECELQIVVTPGFNIDEFLNLEKVARPGVPMVIVNGNLDRVRGGYYPRLFYPGLYNVKERYLKYFEPTFYLKPVPGGFIYRKYPEPWQQVLQYYDPNSPGKSKKIITSVVKTTVDRPVYNDVTDTLKREGYARSRAKEGEE